MDLALESRAAILETFGADTATRAEILAYEADGFDSATLPADIRFPLRDEPFVDAWRGYRDDAAAADVRILADRLVQLDFPVRDGMSQTDDYRAATRRGVSPAELATATGLPLERPEACAIDIHPTWAGSIPLVQVAARRDFVSLVQAFTARNEPIRVSDSMGACMVAGYNNWHRFGQLRDQWIVEHPGEPFAVDCVSHLKDAYQDRFIILSSGWYSDVAPEKVGVPADEWRQMSLTIRREHECAHYWTRRVLSSMKDRVLDEVVADYCGIAAACGSFRADWFLTFFGLEHYPHCREHGRLQNYRGTPPLSDAAFAIVTRLVFAAAANLEAFTRRHVAELSGEAGILRALLTLSGTSLEDLACGHAADLLTVRLEASRGIPHTRSRTIPAS
jgi:hypothetical protein